MRVCSEIIAEETTLALSLIYPNPDQPRKLFDQKALELAENIRQYGVLQPLVVTRRGKKFLLIAGERRWRASQLAGRKYVPVRVIEADDAMVEELALLENIMRRDLNLIEEARGYQALLDRGHTSVVPTVQRRNRPPPGAYFFTSPFIFSEKGHVWSRLPPNTPRN